MFCRKLKQVCALALALCLICSGLAFAGPIDADKGTIRQVQEALNAAGYDCGTADGISGKKTSAAIEAYQEDNDLSVDGKITSELLASLGIELPETASATPKPVKSGMGIRTVSIPSAGGSGTLSDFSYQDILDNIEDCIGLNLRVLGTVDDVHGTMDSETQEELKQLLMSTREEEHYLVDFDESELEFPSLEVGDTITVSGSVSGKYTVGESDDEYYSEGIALLANAIAPGDTLASGGLSNVIIATAQINGELLTVTSGAYSLYDADPEHHLVAMDDSYNGKGFGSPMLVLNYLTGAIYVGSEGAEVYICDNGILRYEWRDAATGEVVDPETVFNYYLMDEEFDPEVDGEPRTFQLYALYYDFDGNLLEEFLVLEYREDEEYDYSRFSKEQGTVETKYKAHSYGNKNYSVDKQYSNIEEIEFVDEDGGAVGYDSNGNFLIRLEDRYADELFGFLLKKQRIISVSFWDEYLTAFFILDE